jgi:integrase
MSGVRLCTVPRMGIEKTSHGTWRARWRHNGHTQSKTFKKKTDATRFLTDTLANLQQGHYRTPSDRITRATVATFADQWLNQARNLSPGGHDTYRRDLDRYILPALGDTPLAALTPDLIDRYLTGELEHLAPSTVHRHYRTIRRLCQVAVERGALPHNPCDPVTPPRIIHTEMRFLTVDQVDQLANTISARYRTWVHVACYAGLRWSETVALRRASIDGPRIAVTEQLVRRNGVWRSEPPKTRAGRRTVTVPPFLEQLLAAHLDEWSGSGPGGLVFPNQGGRPLNGPSFTGNVFKPALVRAGIDRAVRIHDLRHTAVALAILAGAHPKALQARMGHASIAVTLDRYGHLFPEIDGQLAEALGQLRLQQDAPGSTVTT